MYQRQMIHMDCPREMNMTYTSSIPSMDFDTPHLSEEANSSIHARHQDSTIDIDTESMENAEPVDSISSEIVNYASDLSERRYSDPNDISSLWEILRRASMSNATTNTTATVTHRLGCSNTRSSSNDASAESLSDVHHNDNHKEINRPFILGDKVVWIADNYTAEEGIVQWVGQMEGETTAGIVFERSVGNSDGIFKHRRYFKCNQKHGRFLPVQALTHHDDYCLHHSRQTGTSYDISKYVRDLFEDSSSTNVPSTSIHNGNNGNIETEEYNHREASAAGLRPSSSKHFKSKSIAVGLNAVGMSEDTRIKAEDLNRRRKSDVEIAQLKSVSQPPVTLGCIPSGIKLADRIVWINEKEPVQGTVKWIGRIRGHFHAGVELDKPVGNSSGLYGYGNGLSKRLFTCKLSYGRFIPEEEMILYSDYLQAQANSSFFQHVSLEQEDPYSDSQNENSYDRMVAGNNIGDLLDLNDSDPISDNISTTAEMESEIQISRDQQSDKAATKAKLERIFSNRRHSSTTVRYPIRETLIRTGSQASILPSSTNTSTAIDLTSFDILSSEQPVNEIQPTKIQQYGNIGSNVLAELNRAISQRGSTSTDNSCSPFPSANSELSFHERGNISTSNNYSIGDFQNQNHPATAILNAPQNPESDLDMSGPYFALPFSTQKKRSFPDAARQIVSLRKSAQLSALRPSSSSQNNWSNPTQQISASTQESKSGTLKVEDKVVWVTDQRVENGTVKWIGEYKGGTAAGIQFERRIGNTDGKFKGKQYFKCPPKHGGYVPITSLMLQSDYYANPSVSLQKYLPSSNTDPSAPSVSLITANYENEDSDSPKTSSYGDEDSNTIICAICQDSLVKNLLMDDTGANKTDGLITTPCGHLFHGYCLTKWFSTKPNVSTQECPNCMKMMSTTSVIRIYPSVGKP